jgi:endonuclease/exonuclease/phosphatase family metal-dependent hydrolase
MFVEQLGPALQALDGLRPLIVAGDFNRRMPRSWGPHSSYEKLEAAMTGFDIVTRGSLPPLDAMTIDHVAISGALSPTDVRALDRRDASGKARSDHFGVLVDFEWHAGPG